MELKINFSNIKLNSQFISKRAGDMARSEPSDRIAINDRDEEATCHREECPIARDPYQPLIFTLTDGHVA